jgi:hypothetical protein
MSLKEAADTLLQPQQLDEFGQRRDLVVRRWSIFGRGGGTPRSGVGAAPVEPDGAQTRVASAADIIDQAIANVPDVGRVQTEMIEGETEDSGVRFADTKIA